MKRLRVHRERSEQQVVGLSHGTAGLMTEDIANAKFFEIFACHNYLVKAASYNCYIAPSRAEEGRVGRARYHASALAASGCEQDVATAASRLCAPPLPPL